MAATCTRRERPATADELATLLRDTSDAAAFGCLGVLAAGIVLAVSLVVWRMHAWLAFHTGPVVPFLLVPAVAALLVAPLLRSYLRFQAPVNERVRLDHAAAVVEELAIDGAHATLIPSLHSSVDPAFAFELEGDRTLVLHGQWLTRKETFGGGNLPASIDEDDPTWDTANILPPPYAFPTPSFTVHRFPRSGHVVRIELRGDYVEPPELPGSLDLRPINRVPSVLFDGPLGELHHRIGEVRRSKVLPQP